MIYKNFEELDKSDPKQIINKTGNTLERPAEGWIDLGDDTGFIGVGYHGNEGGYFADEWHET